MRVDLARVRELTSAAVWHYSHRFCSLIPVFSSFCITPICFCLLPRLFAATIRSSWRPRAKWSQSCSVSSATSTSFWRITRKVSNLCSKAALECFVQSSPIMQCFFCCFFFKSPSWVLTNTSNTLPLTYAFWACMSMCRRALGRPPARHKCWLLTFSSAVLCWHRLTLHFPLLFNYSVIGIPEVLQFTVRLLEGETHKHRRTCLHTLAFFPTHALAHAQEARMASVGLDVGARCGFRFRVRVISNFSPWNTILFCGETDN